MSSHTICVHFLLFQKVKLTFQCPRIVGPKSSYSILKVPEADLCLAVAGRNLTHIQSELSGIPCVALYLTLVRSSSEAETDEKVSIYDDVFSHLVKAND